MEIIMLYCRDTLGGFPPFRPSDGRGEDTVVSAARVKGNLNL